MWSFTTEKTKHPPYRSWVVTLRYNGMPIYSASSRTTSASFELVYDWIYTNYQEVK